ncbi:putative HTH-type transcriptional regulator LrrA [Planktothrix serta PCC 8927]|uniref:HTH-type transcriptional regulator LrrA n=1 Tax=Planktothrix serta PCC 8927 TaxID=671068 RepID=A0A7Z9DVT9_9CYAN|nr:LysR family transcriptional regulator [Planktothrix serta]VXD13515.1 putative HTH-type transcriptional regulator LrrA [Planktothrix serta PCC 8927]
MNIDQLEILLAVAEQGSFSEAALSLNISQSAVSRAIAALEDELGVPLLLRGRFGARSTLIGERVMLHALKILELREKIDYEVNLEKGLHRGKIRVASFRSAATHILPSKVAQFRNRFPDVEITITETDPLGVEQTLRTGQVDIGLIPLPRSEEFETWEIARDEYVVLVPNSLGQIPKTLTWEELSTYSFILFNYAECTSAVREHWAKWGQSLKVAYQIKEDSTIVSMVAQGLGAAILPRLAALPIPPQVQVRALPVPLERVIGAAIWSNGFHVPAVFAFLDVLRGTGVFSRQEDG